MHEFGATARGETDAWSDIDLQLVVSSMPDAVRGRAGALREIGPVWLEWTIVDSPGSWAATVLFEGMSPWCHLDLGMVGEGSVEKDALLDGAILHWEQPGVVRRETPVPDWYMPAKGTIEHLVLGEVLGLARYAKARHRGQPLLCWKFFAALVNRVLEAEYVARVDPARGFRAPLTSHEHAQLRASMPADEADALAEMFFCEDADAMDAAVVALGKRLVDRSGVTSALFHERCGMLLGWLSREIGMERPR